MYTKPMLRFDSNPRRAQAGLSLIELIAFIVVVGVGLAGILSVLNITLRSSADPLIQKQALAIAESLMEEITSKPFTFCDPDDAQAETATVYAVGADGCTAAATLQGVARQAGENRFANGNNPTPFDNVGDYNGYEMDGGILDPSDGSVISTLANYRARVDVTEVGATFGLADNRDALEITVTVSTSNTGLPPLKLTGYRFRYAPNAF